MPLPLPEYDELDATALAALVSAGEVTPTELIEACIARIDARDPDLNAVVSKQYDQARAAAATGLPEGPFRGVPFLLKDLKGEQAGEVCTDATRILADYRPPRDADLVVRFREAGLNTCGRTNSPEFGIYPVTEPDLHGPTRSPWNRDHTPGGSSGGAAAAVAARYVPAAHASDGGGSIRIPASHSGLVGLKPTRARTPFGPYVMEGWGGFAVGHVVTRTVRDSAGILEAIRGPVAGQPYQVRAPQRPYTEEIGAPAGRLRIAFTKQALFTDTIDPEPVRAVERAAALAADLGHEVVEQHPPFDRNELVHAYFVTVAAGVSGSVAAAAAKVGREPRRKDFEPGTWFLKLIGDALSASEYERCRHVIQRAGRRMSDFMAEHDVILTATTARPPLEIGEIGVSTAEKTLLTVLDNVPSRRVMMKVLDKLADGAMRATANTMLFNQTGQPAISLPLHWSDTGLPIGTQWAGRFGDEATLIRLACQLEEAAPWADRRPPTL